MSQIRLKEMEASEMLDVLHYLFEEDFSSVSEEHARGKSALRESMYKDLYGVTYTFKMKERQTGRSAGGNMTDVQHYEDDFSSLDNAKPFDPRKSDDPFTSPRTTEESKVTFIDSSKVAVEEHFSSVLDGPLN